MAVALDDELNRWEKLPPNSIAPKRTPGDPFRGRGRAELQDLAEWLFLR